MTASQTPNGNGAKQEPIVPAKDILNRNGTGILDQDTKSVLALRNLLFDICNQYGGGHGGSAVGMAAIGVALWKYVMRYNPTNPDWFDRDRFVLSNGENKAAN